MYVPVCHVIMYILYVHVYPGTGSALQHGIPWYFMVPVPVLHAFIIGLTNTKYRERTLTIGRNMQRGCSTQNAGPCCRSMLPRYGHTGFW